MITHHHLNSCHSFQALQELVQKKTGVRTLEELWIAGFAAVNYDRLFGSLHCDRGVTEFESRFATGTVYSTILVDPKMLLLEFFGKLIQLPAPRFRQFGSSIIAKRI
jgi:hypothetical protein